MSVLTTPHALYFDHDCADGDLVGALRLRGIDCLTTEEAGNRLLPDLEQLDFAAAGRRILVTCNIEDFARLHASLHRDGTTHAGIIAMPQMMEIGQKVRRLWFLLHQVDDLRGRFEYLSSWPDE